MSCGADDCAPPWRFYVAADADIYFDAAAMLTMMPRDTRYFVISPRARCRLMSAFMLYCSLFAESAVAIYYLIAPRAMPKSAARADALSAQRRYAMPPCC